MGRWRRGLHHTPQCKTIRSLLVLARPVPPKVFSLATLLSSLFSSSLLPYIFWNSSFFPQPVDDELKFIPTQPKYASYPKNNQLLFPKHAPWESGKCLSSFHGHRAISYDFSYPNISWRDFSGGSVVKNPPTNIGDLGSIPGSGRYLRKGIDNPLQYSCLGSPMDRGIWWATVHGIAKESDTT